MATDLRFCPRCASPLAWRSFEYDDIKHPACTSCGFVLWQNPKPTVEALIVRERDGARDVLLGHQAKYAPDEGWDAPGGYLSLGDELRPALVRECRREMGIDVEVVDLVGAFEDTHLGLPIITLVFQCAIVSGEPRAADIIDDVRWFPLDELPGIAYPSIRQALSVLREQLGG